MKNSLYKKFSITNYTRILGLAAGFMLLHLLSGTASAQLAAARPGPYNSAINYGRDRQSGLIGEDRSYDEYHRYVFRYETARRIRINEEWQDCYRHATNAAQSKVCSNNSQRDISDLAMDVKRLEDNAYLEYLRRKDLIIKYWNNRK